MKTKFRIVFSIIFFISFITYSQIQNNFFVEDAHGVDFIRFELCVNDSAEVYQVKVIPELSTYNNESVIDQLKEYFLSIEFYPDSKLRNDCFETTSTLINAKYQDVKIIGQEIPKDFKFQKGDFKYKNPKFSKSIVKRKKRIQKELGLNGDQIYRIEWLSDSKYNLIYKRMTEERLKKYEGKIINVEILDILSDSSYVYKSTAEHFSWTTYGVMTRVK